MCIRNCWYVIAWDHEIPRRRAVHPHRARRAGAAATARPTGGIVAMEDRCCHRLAPLSKGRKEGDCVRCGYHGLKFSSDGACVEVPGLDTVPPKARVRTYPIAVKNKWVFVWMGDAAKCRHRAAARQLLLRPPRVAQHAGLPALRHQLPADLRQPARLLAPELRAREDARRLDRDRAGARRRSTRSRAASR